jgi:hypothetical protein
MNSPHSSFQLSAFNFPLFPNPSTLKTTVKRLAPLLAALCLMQGVHAQTITSAVPGFISYQGRALNSSGTVMGSGTPVNRTVTFRIWDHPSDSGNLLYSEQQVVTIAEGEFSVLVGAGAAVTGESAKGPPTVKINDLSVFAGVNRYLGVTIDDGADGNTDNEVSPRQQIVASAYALRARYAEQLGSNGGTALTALDSGNVGIGNTNPPARFTVTGANIGTSSANPQLIVTDNADPNKRLRLGVDSTGTGTGFIQSFKEGTGAQNLLLNPSGGNVGIGGTATPAVALSVTGAITATGAITGGSFATAGNITTSSGNVGIGTTNPTSKLDVNGNVMVRGQINLDSAIVMGDGPAIWGKSIAGVYEQAFWPRSADGTYIKYGNSGFYITNNAGINSMVMTHGGKVGIGNDAPGFPLTMANSLGDKIALYSGTASTSYGFGIQGSLLQIHTDSSASDVAFGHGSSAAMVETMRIKGNGNVGIGTTGPAAQLHLNGAAGTGGPVRGGGALYLQDSGASVGNGGALLFGASQGMYAGIKGFAVNGTSNTVGDLAFYTRRLVADTTLTESMRIKDNGNVQIGTTSNEARLNIGTIANTTNVIGYLDTSGGQSGDLATSRATSIKSDGAIIAPYIGVYSDLRIKTDLHATDSVKDLEALMGIQVTNYHYKDKVANGNTPQKKVVAQQLEKVYPQAVNTNKGVVPDIYKKVTVKDGWVELATDLKVGDRVRLISEKEEGVHEVLEVKAGRFLTEFKPAGDQVFVYGREVNDFRSVDYDAIAMLNVSATQELARQLETVQAENAALRREVAAKDRELAAKDESMEARLIALERRMSGESVPVTVSLKTASTAK